MITLHGFSYSNYYNIVKHVLMHKGIPFVENLQFGGDEEFRNISPLGKVPAITTEDGGYLSESSVCCDYLEEAYPEHSPLYPADPYGRAQVRQVMKVSELYLELAARRLIPFSITRSAVPPVVATEVTGVLEKGVLAMNQLCSFAHCALGEKITLSDIYLRYVLSVVDMAKAGLERDFASEIQGLAPWRELMASTDIAKKIDADREANGPAFFAFIQERYGIS